MPSLLREPLEKNVGMMLVINCKVVFCRVGTNHTRVFTRVFTPGIKLQKTFVVVFMQDINTRTWKFLKFCTTVIPVPGTSGSSVRQCHKYPGYGYIIFKRYQGSARAPASPAPMLRAGQGSTWARKRKNVVAVRFDIIEVSSNAEFLIQIRGSKDHILTFHGAHSFGKEG